MKKTVIKLSVFLLTFVLALIVMERLMNEGHNNMTMEMADASLPVVTMLEQDVPYNRLFGYRNAMDVAFQRDTMTVLGESREVHLRIKPYGRGILGIAVEVRSADGSRLVENTEITGYEVRAEEMQVSFALKDLIEENVPYSMALVLTLEDGEEIRYYTQVVWNKDTHLEEHFAFVQDFHERLYDREAARELTKYLETNAQLESNLSFHKVNIHSSFKQITWGDLDVQEVEEPSLKLVDITGQVATVLLDYYVSTWEDRNIVYYRVKEYYRVRYTEDRMYLLAYERTMEQLPDEEEMYANDKILLGITDADVEMMESADGNVLAFLAGGRLFSYNAASDKLAVLFGFYDSDHADERTLHDEHGIKIMDVDEGGNVLFAVYGYMNRGRHEGEVGIQMYAYDSSLNTIEELVYIPSDKTYTVINAELSQLLYMNREQQMYLLLEDEVLHVDLMERTYQVLVRLATDESLQVSADHRILVWQDGEDIYQCRRLNVRDLNVGEDHALQVGADEAIRPLGFMGEDIIYGVARNEDLRVEKSGRTVFPMYKLIICSTDGDILKEYRQEQVYVTGCSIADNQITLERVEKTDSGDYRQIADDQITNNASEQTEKNIVVVANIDRYEQYVQIQTRKTIDTKNIKILTPKEVVFEGGRVLRLDLEDARNRYYVYGPYGVETVYDSPALAVNRAYDVGGRVVDGNGTLIWRRETRVARNQIMAIKEDGVDEDRNSLAVCLDTILRYEGITRNTAQLLNRGRTVQDILRDNLPEGRVMDLTGCSLDAVLYYVNRDIPVLALLGDDQAVLVTGFNEYNVVIMEPETSSLYKKGMNDATEWFAENGNRFVTYLR